MKAQIPREIQDLAERQAALCRLFGTPQRVLILWLVGERERTVSEIAFAIGASLSSTSQHLRRMELCNVVESRRESHHIFYRVADNRMLQKCGILTGRPRKRILEPAYA
jgi:DNA-binding transcriptional ArsR family regulator